MMVRYGGPPQPEAPVRANPPSQRESADIYGAPPPLLDQAQDSGVASGPNDPGGMVEAYGAPPPPNTSNRDR